MTEILEIGKHQLFVDGTAFIVFEVFNLVVEDDDQLLEAVLTYLVEQAGDSSDVAVNEGQVLQSAWLLMQFLAVPI